MFYWHKLWIKRSQLCQSSSDTLKLLPLPFPPLPFSPPSPLLQRKPFQNHFCPALFLNRCFTFSLGHSHPVTVHGKNVVSSMLFGTLFVLASLIVFAQWISLTYILITLLYATLVYSVKVLGPAKRELFSCIGLIICPGIVIICTFVEI